VVGGLSTGSGGALPSDDHLPPPFVRIGDADDPRVDDHRDLPGRARRSAAEDQGTLVVEGHVAIRRLLASPLVVRSLLLTPRGARLLADDLGGAAAPAYVAEPDVVAAVVGFDLHRGAVAVAERPQTRDPEDVLAGAEVVAVLEGVNDRENLGAVARSAVALGIDALLLAPDCADPLSRRSIRVSMGHVLTLPLAHLAPWPSALARLGADGWAVVALTPRVDAPALADVLAGQLGRVALLLGAEGPGLSAGALGAATRSARIPMVPGIDSLNVSHAAAIAFAAAGRAHRQP
jgi:tRNA G18 (ribose-2'-O)-methylase SpoU